MRTPDDRAPTNSETERLDRPERVETVERVERVVPVAPVAPAGQVNVNAARTDPVWSVTRVVVLLFTVSAGIYILAIGLVSRWFGRNLVFLFLHRNLSDLGRFRLNSFRLGNSRYRLLNGQGFKVHISPKVGF